MFRKSTLALAAVSFVASSLFANTLEFKSGFIQANTSIMGDSNINPKSTAITTALSIEGTPQTLKGDISLDLLSLKSENSSRDEHMYEALKAKENKLVSFSIKEVTKVENGYTIFGTLHLNHVDKEVQTVAKINESDDTMTLKGGFSIKMSDFKIEPPTLLFLSVRDQVDINYALELSQK
jgi:polyisoprenoid-binding protein YceI